MSGVTPIGSQTDADILALVRRWATAVRNHDRKGILADHDLDIVMFERQSVREPGLTVPHPELSNRDFWLRELATLRSARVG